MGEAVATVLNQGEDEFWNALWLDTKLFLQELDGAVQSMSKRGEQANGSLHGP